MTYTTPELVTYGKVQALTNGGGAGFRAECTEDGIRYGQYGYQCP